jgi:hypothetical protein
VNRQTATPCLQAKGRGADKRSRIRRSGYTTSNTATGQPETAMALNIRNREAETRTERLAALTGETLFLNPSLAIALPDNQAVPDDQAMIRPRDRVRLRSPDRRQARGDPATETTA